jgi:hypothetical protein
MRLAFLPGGLFLSQEKDDFVVTLDSKEVLRTRSQKRAVTRFNGLRKDMEHQFPNRDLSPEEKHALLQKEIADSLVDHNPVRPKRRKYSRGSTRTFG